MSKLFKLLESLDECKCSGDDKKCKCKKGEKCDGKNCTCKKIKEDVELDEKRMSDEEGDFRMHDKKDREAENTKKCPNCKTACKSNKCPSCGKEILESKYDKYLLVLEEADLQEKEDQLMEGTIAGDLRKELLAAGLGVGIPSSGLTVDGYRNILAKLQGKGLTDLAGKLKSGIAWSKVEQDNMNKFK